MSWTICNLFLPKNLIVTPEKTTTKSHDYGHTTTHDAKHTPTAMSLKGHCETCGAVKSSDGSACKKCACKQVYYCSKECQRTDWDHKARCKKARATAHNAGEAIPGLPQDVVVTHILRSDTDPIVIARLRAVSRPMRDAVDQTRLFVEEMPTERAAELGCLDTLHHQLLKGRLNKSIVCEFAAQGGQLEMLQWGHANGCLWDEKTCMNAAQGGHLEVIQWAHERLLLEQEYMRGGGEGRASRGAPVGAHEWRAVVQIHVHVRGAGRPPRDAAVGARERLPLG